MSSSSQNESSSQPKTLEKRGPKNEAQKHAKLDEINARKEAKKAINQTFNRQVNTRDCKFVPLRGITSYETLNVTVNKGENKVKVHVVSVLSDLAKNKSTIRKESSVIDEIHQLPPFVKNQNLAEKITAKYYSGQGVVITMPAKVKRNNNKNENNNNKENNNNNNDNNDNDNSSKRGKELTQNPSNSGDQAGGSDVEIHENDNKSQGRKFVEVDISEIVASAVDLEVKFE